MKKLIFIIFSLALTIGVTAQSGKITYKETMKLNIKLDDAQGGQLADMLPRENVSEKILLFTPTATFYEQKEKNEEQMVTENNGIATSINIVQPDNKVYYDLKNQKKTEQRDFLGRNFLIESEPDTLNWKITGKQKTIAGRNCMEATTQYKENKISAWFTPEIPVSSGPGNLHGLPGMILHADINDGQQIITATQISLEPIDAKGIAKPQKGKKVTKAEFEKIVEEKNKELGNGSGGNAVIKIITK